MRRDALLGLGFLIAAIGEIATAGAEYAAGSPTAALVGFVAGAAFLLVSGGLVFSEQATWALTGGLVVAALAHLVLFALDLHGGALVVTATALAFVGLGLAAFGAWGAALRSGIVRFGIALAALGGLVRLYADATAGASSLLVGDVFFTIGLAAAAALGGSGA
jgi:hypothetical protein